MKWKIECMPPSITIIACLAFILIERLLNFFFGFVNRNLFEMNQPVVVFFFDGQLSPDHQGKTTNRMELYFYLFIDFI